MLERLASVVLKLDKGEKRCTLLRYHDSKVEPVSKEGDLTKSGSKGLHETLKHLEPSKYRETYNRQISCVVTEILKILTDNFSKDTRNYNIITLFVNGNFNDLKALGDNLRIFMYLPFSLYLIGVECPDCTPDYGQIREFFSNYHGGRVKFFTVAHMGELDMKSYEILKTLPEEIRDYYHERPTMHYEIFLENSGYKPDEWLDLTFSISGFELLGSASENEKPSKRFRKNLGQNCMQLEFYYWFAGMGSYVYLDCSEVTEKISFPEFRQKLRVPWIFGLDQKLKVKILTIQDSGEKSTTEHFSLFNLTEIIGNIPKSSFSIKKTEKSVAPGQLHVKYQHCNSRDSTQAYKFIDYLENGYNLGLGVGIDFNKSNDPRGSPGSNHYVADPDAPNPFQQLTQYIGSNLCNFDQSEQIPTYALGGSWDPQCLSTIDQVDFDQEGLQLKYRAIIKTSKLKFLKDSLKNFKVVINGDVCVDGIHSNIKDKLIFDIPNTQKFSIDIYDDKVKTFNHEILISEIPYKPKSNNFIYEMNKFNPENSGYLVIDFMLLRDEDSVAACGGADFKDTIFAASIRELQY
jgi:hypothetical protein